MTGSSEDFFMRSIRIVPFSGAKQYWFKWKSKFIVVAIVKKYYKMMEGTVKIPDENTTDPKEMIDYERSILGYMDIVQSC